METGHTDQVYIGCPSPEIAAYIDGELDPNAEYVLESHVSGCDTCLSELNFQKHFLNRLDQTLKDGDAIDLPSDFASTIAIRAESSVIGLRGSRERFLAGMVCAVFALSILALLTLDSGVLASWAASALEKAAAVAILFSRLVYSFFYGTGVILRSLGGPYLLPGSVMLISLGAFAVIFVSITRVIFRARRT